MIETLQRMGKLEEKVPGGPDLTDSDMKIAKDATLNSAEAKI